MAAGTAHPVAPAPTRTSTPAGPAGAVAQTPPAASLSLHQALLDVGIELFVVMVLVVLAGQSQRGGRTALAIVSSLWVVAAINHYAAGGRK